MTRRVLCACVLAATRMQEGDLHISPSDCMQTVEEDWEADSELLFAGDADGSGVRVMGAEAFARSWFELVDVPPPTRH